MSKITNDGSALMLPVMLTALTLTIHTLSNFSQSTIYIDNWPAREMVSTWPSGMTCITLPFAVSVASPILSGWAKPLANDTRTANKQWTAGFFYSNTAFSLVIATSETLTNHTLFSKIFHQLICIISASLWKTKFNLAATWKNDNLTFI